MNIPLRRFAFATHRCPPSKGEVGLAKGVGGDVVFRPYRHLPAVLRQARRSPFESLDPGPAFYQQACCTPIDRMLMKGFFYRASYLFILLCYVPAVSAQVLQVTLQEVLTIGDDEEAAKEYLFAGPSHIQVDEQGRIYVADMHQASIRVFNAKGVFITRIGSRGQGPGEFSYISAVTIDHHGDLMVLDQLNNRITRYSQMGEQFETYPIPEEFMVIAHQMWPLADDGFAIAFMEQDHRSDFVHIYDTDFKSLQESLIPRSDIWDLSKPFENAVSSFVRNTSFAYDGERYFVVPYIYQGELYVYTRTTTSGTPQVWHGHALDGPPYTLLDFDEAFKDGKIMYPTAHYITQVVTYRN